MQVQNQEGLIYLFARGKDISHDFFLLKTKEKLLIPHFSSKSSHFSTVQDIKHTLGLAVIALTAISKKQCAKKHSIKK